MLRARGAARQQGGSFILTSVGEDRRPAKEKARLGRTGARKTTGGPGLRDTPSVRSAPVVKIVTGDPSVREAAAAAAKAKKESLLGENDDIANARQTGRCV